MGRVGPDIPFLRVEIAAFQDLGADRVHHFLPSRGDGFDRLLAIDDALVARDESAVDAPARRVETFSADRAAFMRKKGYERSCRLGGKFCSNCWNSTEDSFCSAGTMREKPTGLTVWP